VLTLARVKSHIAEQINKLPAYTCLLETVRTARSPSAKKFERVDRLRLEVVLSGKRELYAWPGDKDFSDAAINELVRGGAINSGSFGLFTRDLFVSNVVSFEYEGESTAEGRRALQYGFRVPQFLSGFTMLSHGASGRSGYQGRFWADRDTHDLLMITLKASDIPPGVPYADSQLSIRYGKVAELGGVSLPATSTLVARDLFGTEYRNDTTFSRCREFRAESTVLVEDVSSQLVSEPQSAETPRIPEHQPETSPRSAGNPLPAGLRVKIRLDAPIDFATSAAGDRVRGLVTENVEQEGSVLLPKDAAIDGRLVRFQRESAGVFLVGLRFTGYEIAGRRYRFHARLMSADRRKTRVLGVGGGGIYGTRLPSIDQITEPLTDWERENNSFYSSDSKLSRGFRTTWITQPAP
jgi:hypothetical protein